jgi:transposase
MLGQNPSQPAFFQMVDIDALVPEDHRLRQIDAALDLGFVREALAERYTPGRGRPSIDPELAVRMMILGVLYDLSDRQLCDEIRMHAGFRWFCRLNFHDPVPDHSTLSRLRNERWAGSELFTRLFDEVVRSCQEAGLVSGRHVSVDGTQIKANASMQSLEARTHPEKDRDNDDDAGVTPTTRRVEEPQPEGVWQGHGRRYSNETHVSRTDPEAQLYRKGSNEGAKLSYLVHDLVDTKSRVILGRCASEATGTAERSVALLLLDEHEMRRERLGIEQPVEILTADAGYGVSAFVAEVLDRGVVPHTPLQAKGELEPIPTWKRRTFNEAHRRARAEKVRLASARNRVRLAQQTEGYAVSRKLRIRSEHIFAEAKTRHGLGCARHRGLVKVDQHARLIAAVQNLKRLGRTLWRQRQDQRGDSPRLGPLVHALHTLRARLNDMVRHARMTFPIGTACARISAWICHHRMAHCSTAF